MSAGVGDRVVLGEGSQLPGRHGVVVSVHPTGMVSVRLDDSGGVLAVAGSRVEPEQPAVGVHRPRVTTSGADVAEPRLFASCTGCGWQASGYGRAEVAQLHSKHVAEVARAGMAAILERAARPDDGVLF